MSPTITIRPARPTLDTELAIRLTGFPPRAPVTLRAETRTAQGARMAAEAVFGTDADGSVDVSGTAPIGGSYVEADPMGLIWSMTAEGPPEPAAGVDPTALPPASTTFYATVNGTPAATVTVDRLRRPDAVVRTEVRDHGLVGTLYHPDGARRAPGIILLGGAEGGLHELDAALLAGHGFAVLALAYFGMPGLPPALVDIPLEYFGTAIGYLAADPRVDGERIGIVGGSRGGEAALLVSATFPDVRAVVSTVGSGLMTQGIPLRPSFVEMVGTAVPSWTLRGTSLPYLPMGVPEQLRRQVAAGEPVELGLAFIEALKDHEAVRNATIPVERINGPVLLLSAGDDRGWPSGELSELAMARMAAEGHRYPRRHICYPEAGHPIAPPPYGPATDLVAPGPGVQFASGGTPAANAAARADAWRRMSSFFGESLRR